jgi:hypothetical protein
MEVKEWTRDGEIFEGIERGESANLSNTIEK